MKFSETFFQGRLRDDAVSINHNDICYQHVMAGHPNFKKLKQKTISTLKKEAKFAII